MLARFLVPEEYGEVSAAAIVILTASSITTFGVGTYLIAHRELPRSEVFHATVFFLATGAIALLVAVVLSEPIGRWADAPRLDQYLMPFLIGSMFERVTFIPERMLVRQLRFGWLSIARGLGELIFTGVSVGLAAAGLGAISIAWANLSRSVLKFLLVVPAVNLREWLEPHRLEAKTFKRIFSFGTVVSVSGIATFAMRRWDNLLVSRYYGTAVMGAYNYAYNLADTPAVAIGEQMSDVIGASLPHAEPGKRAAALIKSCTMISLIMFPLAFGLGAVAPTVVATFFTKKWESVGTMLIYLSVLSAPRPIFNIIQSYFYACNRPRTVLILEWLSLGAIVAGIATIGRISVDWACAAVGAVFVLRTLAGMWAVRRDDRVPMSRFMLPLLRPLLACGVMVAAIYAIRPALAGLAPSRQLIVEVMVGGVVYIASALAIAGSAAREFLSLIRSTLKKG